MANSPAAIAMKDLGIEGGGLERRLQFVGLGPNDLPLIQRLRPIVQRDADALTDRFFDYLKPFEEAKALLGHKEIADLARRAKREHLVAMAAGRYDEAYATERVKLALLYSQARLDPRVFLGAFHHLMRGIGEKVMAELPDAFGAFMALKKVAFMDIGLIIDVLAYERERVIRQQAEALRELSTPVLQIRERLLLLPIIGVIDTLRARQMTESLLRAIRIHRAKVVVMDVTGVATIDSRVANHLVQTVTAARLMGAKVIVSGLSAEVAQSLVQIGVDLRDINTVGDLQGGIEEAEQLLGYRIVNGEPGTKPAVA